MANSNRAFLLVCSLSAATLTACDRSAPPAPGASSKPSTQQPAQPPTPKPVGPSAANPAPSDPAKGDPAPPPQEPPAKEDVADITSPTFILGGMKFTKPKAWTRTAPSNSMRKAEFRIPAPNGNTAEDCVVAFSQAGGAVKWNLDRWKTQVTTADNKPAESTITIVDVAGIKVHVFTSTGSYQDGMPGGPKTPREKWTLRGAVLETTPMLTFAKMFGPEDAMKASQADWDAMIAGLVKAD
jgi:hypothetical protein